MEIKTSEDLIKKINELKTKIVDLSADEDLAVGVMNLISMEEHLFYTYQKTGKEEYLNLLEEVRNTRKKMMEKLVGKPEGELWCFIKHTLSASMRLMEVGNKLFSQGKKEEAKELYDLSYELFNIFWGIKLEVINLNELSELGPNILPELESNKLEDLKKTKEENVEETKEGFSLKKIVEKLIDCCKE